MKFLKFFYGYFIILSISGLLLVISYVQANYLQVQQKIPIFENSYSLAPLNISRFNLHELNESTLSFKKEERDPFEFYTAFNQNNHLELLEPDALKNISLVGIIINSTQKIALLQTENGHVYVAHEGDTLNSELGRVHRISKDTVYFDNKMVLMLKR